MNWGRIVLAGVAAGVVVNLADFVMHGLILSGTYMEYPEVFTQEQANPLYFFLVAVCIALAAAILFARSYKCWTPGAAGGATFGFFVGLLAFFPPFYNPLIIDGFPYFLSWCWGGVNLIDGVVGGLVLGLLYKEA